MFDYVFLHRELADKFTRELQRLAVPFESRDDQFGHLVAIPEDLDDAVNEEIEALYETLFDESETFFDSEESGKHVAGINITLSDGTVTQAAVRPELMNKVLGVLSFEELNELVETIVECVEHPDTRPFCQR